METIDPATGQPLPGDAIQRILFIANAVHVYNIPPLASNKGYMAADWTVDPQRQIFTARARVIETAYETDGGGDDDNGNSGGQQRLKVDIVLEDKANGQLFAAAPYTSAAVVEPVLDSSRFFAVRVQDGAGRKATLGIGFEERGEAFDFGVALQEARKALALDDSATAGAGSGSKGAATAAGQQGKAAQVEEKRDYSLKEGETITVNLGNSRFGRRSRPMQPASPPPGGDAAAAPANLNSFALAPPPSASAARSGSGSGSGGGGGFSLPPPPSASHARTQSRSQKQTAQEMGFDDGKFGEFA